MVAQLAYATTATALDECRFAGQRIKSLLAGSRDSLWYELLMRPGNSVSPEEFAADPYRTMPAAVVDSQVVERAARWLRKQPSPTRLSINTHPQSLLEPRFVESVSRLQYELAALGHAVGLELIEFADCGDRIKLARQARLLRHRGVHIALDDFGTGVNCLDLCAAGAIDAIKIDTSVIGECDRDRNRRAIIEGITTMARGLGVCVIAEGVERQGEARLLAELGVDYAQGFLYQQPKIMGI